MIKKFKEFNESITNIISIEEVEDQFLRLKEVLNCRISIQLLSLWSVEKYFSIYVGNEKYGDITPETIKELKQIRNRVRLIYPTMEVFIIRNINNVIYCYLYNKDDKAFLIGVNYSIESSHGSWKKLEDWSDYIIESSKNVTQAISDIISYDEVEDQFLRLKEILNCGIKISEYTYFYSIGIACDVNKSNVNKSKEISDELRQIRKRIETIYPKLTILISVNRNNKLDSVYCFIHKKDTNHFSDLYKVLSNPKGNLKNLE